MADSARFDDYTIRVVHGVVEDRLADEITAFWKVNGALTDPREARRRVAEVVCVARNLAGEIVGLNSVYLSTVNRPPQPYYIYRTFIRSTDRVLGLARCMYQLCFAHLRAHRQDRGILGIAMAADNGKFMMVLGQPRDFVGR